MQWRDSNTRFSCLWGWIVSQPEQQSGRASWKNCHWAVKGEAISDWENSKCKGRGWVEWAQERDEKTSRAFHRRETDVQEMHEGMPDLMGHQGNANQDHDAMLIHTLSIRKKQESLTILRCQGRWRSLQLFPTAEGRVHQCTQWPSKSSPRSMCSGDTCACIPSASASQTLAWVGIPRILLKGRFWFSGSRAGPKILHF